jgi:hypothetical protein
MMKKSKGLILAIGVLTASVQANAADWLMLQGTEPQDAGHRYFGAVQATYANNIGCNALSGLAAADGTPTGNLNAGQGLNNGRYNNNCTNSPKFSGPASVAIDTLMLGVRGNIAPGKINYFLAANLGENNTTYLPFKTSRERLAALTDASVTFSYIPGARMRAGLFKKPGPEELMQSVEAGDYVFPTDFVARVQQERFIHGNAQAGIPVPGQGYAGNISAWGYDFDAGRDWGAQLFDAFKRDKWTYAYAAMIANGNGIRHSDNNSDKDANLYVSAEHDLPGGKGPFKHGVKLYGYHQQGVRHFTVDAAGTQSRGFDRIRYGIGARALGELFGEQAGKHRLGFELMYADGMIHYIPTGNIANGAFGGNAIQIAAERGNKARGLTLDYGYYLNPSWQLDVRYSRHDLLYQTAGVWKSSDLRVFDYLTLGANYYFAPRIRLTVDYEFRDVRAPNAVVPAAGTAAAVNNAAVQTRNANIMVDSIGDRFGARLTYSF